MEPRREKHRKEEGWGWAAKLEPTGRLGAQCVITVLPACLARWGVSRCFFLPSGVTSVRARSSRSCHHQHSRCPGPPPSGWRKVYKCPSWTRRCPSGWVGRGLGNPWALVDATPDGMLGQRPLTTSLGVHTDSHGKGTQCSCGFFEAPDTGDKLSAPG